MRWRGVSKPYVNPDASDGVLYTNEMGDLACRLHHLCTACRNAFQSGGILQGSLSSVLTRVERIDQYHSVAEMEQSARLGCHVCTIIQEEYVGLCSQPDKSQHAGNVQDTSCPSCMMSVQFARTPSFQSPVSVEILFGRSSACSHRAPAASPRDQGGLLIELGCTSTKILPEVRDKHPATYSLNTGSNSHMDLARFWLNKCQSLHSICRLPSSEILPSRLVQINHNETGVPSLRIVDVDRQALFYACLSHCWGGVSDILQLTSSNKDMLYNQFMLSSLPKTFRDAVQTVCALGLHYLWIDCLCILQRDAQDWAIESAKMGAIFQNATVTIAATAATNPHAGFFRDRQPLEYSSCKIAEYRKKKTQISRIADSPAVQWQHSSLAGRGWCYQEYILSPRTLSFGRQRMSWLCMVGQAQEDNILGIGRMRDPHPQWKVEDRGINDDLTFSDSRTTLMTLKHSAQTQFLPAFSPEIAQLNLESATILHVSARGNAQLRLLMSSPWTRLEDPFFYSLHRSWFALVYEYSGGLLTQGEDKLIAIAGVAEQVISQCSLTYVVGLWQESLVWDLMWFISRPAPRPQGRHRGPTWSWTSVDGRVHSWLVAGYDRKHIVPMTQLQSIVLSPVAASDINRTGQIASAIMTLKAKVKPARLLYRKTPSELSLFWNAQTDTSIEYAGIPHESAYLFKLCGQSDDESCADQQILGTFWPDIYPFDHSTVWLMPLCRAQRAETHGTMYPYWAMWEEHTTSHILNQHQSTICGLALVPSSTRETGDCWTRVGIFHFDFNDPASEEQATWFDDVSGGNMTLV